MPILQTRTPLSGTLADTKGIKPQSEKIKAISEMKLPRNQKGVREFLGMVSYYKKNLSIDLLMQLDP